LQPLPAARFDTSHITHRQATRDCTVHYRGNVYSVPAAHAGQMLLLKETEEGCLRIYTAEQSLVAEHRLVSGRYQRVLVESHYAGLPGLPQPQPRPRPRRSTPLARQVILIQPELAPAVQARPLSVYAQVVEGEGEVEADHD
jgi:hypothetical protein